MNLDDFFNADPTSAPIEHPTAPIKEDIVDPIEPQDPIEDDADPVDPVEPETTEDDSADEGDPTTKAYFDFLQEYDILRTPEDFEFDGSPAKLKEALDHTKQSLAQEVASNLWSALPENFRPLLEYGLRGGTSLDEYMNAYSEIDFKNLDLDNEDIQRRVMTEYYRKTTTQPLDKINRFIARLEDSGDLRTEAQDALEELSLMQEKQKAELMAKAEKERMQNAQRQKEKVDSLVNAIESSTAIHPSRRSKLRSFFFSPIKLEDTTTTGFNYTIDAIMQNPEHQAQLADLLLEYDPKKGFSLERFEKRAASKATKTFHETLVEKLETPLKSSASKNSPTSSSKFDWNAFNRNL